MASDQTENIVKAIQSAQKTYTPSPRVVESLKDKTLVMMVGPVAIGKSFIIDKVTEKDQDFMATPTFTTRGARPDDAPGLFITRPHTEQELAEILDEIQQGELVQYVIHPTTHNIYGTKPEYYSAKYNFLPTLSSSVGTARKPFGNSIALFIVARPEVWKMWLDARYPIKNEERAKRIHEAIISLEWGLANEDKSNIAWVENSIQTPEKTVEEVINIVKYKKQGDKSAKEYARQMLKLAKSESGEVN